MSLTTAPEAPATANAPVTADAPAPAKKKRERGPELPWQFPTAEAALAEAKNRTAGQKRRPYTVELPNKPTAHIIAYSDHDAAGWYLKNIAGGKVTALGVRTRTKTPPTADAALAFLNSLPEAERAKVLAALGKK